MATVPSDKEKERDRYAESTQDLANHIGDKVMAFINTPENQARIQTVLDPIVSHIINRVFPYILLSAILFLILLLLTAGTFWMSVRGSVLTQPLAVVSALVEASAV